MESRIREILEDMAAAKISGGGYVGGANKPKGIRHCVEKRTKCKKYAPGPKVGGCANCGYGGAVWTGKKGMKICTTDKNERCHTNPWLLYLKELRAVNKGRKISPSEVDRAGYDAWKKSNGYYSQKELATMGHPGFARLPAGSGLKYR